MNYFKFYATSSTTAFSILKTSTMAALPWWKRISRKSPSKFLIQKSPSSKSSSTTTSTTTQKTTTTRPTTTLRSIARSPTTPLTTSTTTTTTRRSHNLKSDTFNKPYNTPKPSLVKKTRTRSQLRSLISGHSRRNRKGDKRSGTSSQNGTTTGKTTKTYQTFICLPSLSANIPTNNSFIIYIYKLHLYNIIRNFIFLLFF